MYTTFGNKCNPFITNSIITLWPKNILSRYTATFSGCFAPFWRRPVHSRLKSTAFLRGLPQYTAGFGSIIAAAPGTWGG